MSVISGLKSNSVFDRLNDPSTFTGVYAERFRSGPGINSDGDTGSGTNTRDLSQLTRENLNRDSSPKLRAAERNRARLESAERQAMDSGYPSFQYPDGGSDALSGSGTSGDEGDSASALNNATPLDTNTQLQLLYSFYCRFGRTAGSGDEASDIDNVNFAKMARECPGLLNNVLTPTEVDLIFVKCKAKTARRMTYGQFLDALSAMATVRYHEVAQSDPVRAFSMLLNNHVFKCPASIGIAAAVRSGMLQLGPVESSAAPPSGGAPGSQSRRRNSQQLDPASMDMLASAAATLSTQSQSPAQPPQPPSQYRSPSSPAVAAPPPVPSSSGSDTVMIGGHAYVPVVALMPSPGAPGDASQGIPAGYLPVQVLMPTSPLAGYPIVSAVAGASTGVPIDATTNGRGRQMASASTSNIHSSPSAGVAVGHVPSSRPRGNSASSASVLSYSFGAAAPGTYPHPAGSVISASSGAYRARSARASRSPSRGSVLGGGAAGGAGLGYSSSGSVLGSGQVSTMGSPSFKPTMAGQANKAGGVYERLASPTSFTGIYRRAWLTDGRINHFADTGVSRIPSKFEGSTNTGSNETIHDLKHLLRPNLGVGKGFRP